MPKTVCQSIAWFKRYKTLKSVTVGRSVGSLNLRKFSYSAKTRSAFGLARNKKFVQFSSPASSRWMTVRSVQFGTRRLSVPVQFVQFSSVGSVHELFRPRPWTLPLTAGRRPMTWPLPLTCWAARPWPCSRGIRPHSDWSLHTARATGSTSAVQPSRKKRR